MAGSVISQPLPSFYGTEKKILRTKTGAGEWRCCQSTRNLSPMGRALPFPSQPQAMRFCHSAGAAERRVL